MPKEVTITLDSGCFLTKKGIHCEIGYFQCEPSAHDIEVAVDGQPMQNPNPIKLGTGSCVVQIHHKDGAGVTKSGGIQIPVPFRHKLLHMENLYPGPVEIDENSFDCILRFESGEFSVDDIRKRKFKRLSKLANDDLSPTPEETKELEPIAHDIKVRFELADDDSMVLTRDGTPFWSSGQFNNTLEIKLCVDDSTTEGFYRRCFKHAKDSYWLPNPDDPPPFCPMPPCQDGA